MLNCFDFLSMLSSLNLDLYALGTGLCAALPLLGMSMATGREDDDSCDCGDEGCGCGDHEIDVDTIKARVAQLEETVPRTLEQNEELADSYVTLALAAFEEGEDLNEIIESLNQAEKVLKETLQQGEDDEIRRRLGNVYLHRAVVQNDYDELDDAIMSYTQAIDALTPLDNQADGEAKYDIAGIKLNRGTIYHEIGDLDKAKADFEDSFMNFRAVEKITDLDTRFFMAKVSVAQGSLLRDLGEPLDKIVDAYNRAMRLFVELIDVGQLEHEHDLANTLMDRCAATYEDYKGREFESETEKINKIGDVLIDVNRAIEILERLAEDGYSEVRPDLFGAITTEGAMLLDLEKYSEAKSVFDRALNEFRDFAGEADPVLLSNFAAAHENRGFCLLNMGESDQALIDFDESIRLCEIIQSPEFDLDDSERTVFLPSLATYYANRANAQASLGNIEAAKSDCQHGLDMIRSLKDQFGADEIAEIEGLFENMLAQWK